MPYTDYLKMGHRPEVKGNATHSIQKQSWEEWGLDKRVMERGSSLQLSYIGACKDEIKAHKPKGPR